MTNDKDPWTYQIAVGLEPQCGPATELHYCPACGGIMRATGYTSYGSGRFWCCVRCRLEVIRPNLDLT